VTSEETYVTAAYAVVLGAVLLWVVIYAFRMARLQREVAELAELAARRKEEEREPERVGSVPMVDRESTEIV
jgi:hypothetical protein